MVVKIQFVSVEKNSPLRIKTIYNNALGKTVSIWDNAFLIAITENLVNKNVLTYSKHNMKSVHVRLEKLINDFFIFNHLSSMTVLLGARVMLSIVNRTKSPYWF